jgi:hypothetical protein
VEATQCRNSNPALVVQFRRRWDADPATIKFLSELSEAELDRLTIAHGERIVRRLPAVLTAGLTSGERRDLACAFRPSTGPADRGAGAGLTGL